MPERWLVPVEAEPPTLGAVLRNLREQRGLLQGEAAEGLGLAQNTLSAYELNKSRPNPQTMHRLAAYYGTTVGKLQAVANRHDLWQMEHQPIPGDGIAVETTPNLRLLIERVKDADDAHFPRLTEVVTRVLRDLEQGRGGQDEQPQEPTGS